MVRALFAVLLGILVLRGVRAGEEEYYRMLTLPTPEGLLFEVSGLETLRTGSLAVALRKGEVWLIKNAYQDPPEELQLKRIAYALHEPLGLLEHGDSLYLAQRSELTRMRDRNADGVMDEYRTLYNGWGITGNYHEYAYGPKVDKQGNFWVTLNSTIGDKATPNEDWRGWGLRITPEGKMVPVSAGMRSPSGLGVNADGEVFFTDQQGNWIPTCTLSHMQDGDFFGHVDSLKFCSLLGSPIQCPDKIPSGIPILEARKQLPILKLPAVWFPYNKVARSTTDIVCDQTRGNFGPFENQLFVGDFTMALISRVYLEKVQGEYQGACFPFRKGFQSAVVRLAWGKDGSLFVGETNRGWNSIGNRSFGLQRLIWTGKVPFEVKEMRAMSDGFELVFTQPVDRSRGSDPQSYRMLSYTYLFHPDYGSPEIDTQTPKIRTASVAASGRRVRLVIDGLREGYVHELQLPGVTTEEGKPLLHERAYYTLNQIPR